MLRVLSALVLLPLVAGVVQFLHPLATLVLVEVVLLAALLEYANLAARAGAPLPTAPTAAAALSTCAVVGLAPSLLPVTLMAVTVGLAVAQLPRWPRQRAPVPAASATFAVLYLALPLGALAGLRYAHGPEVLLLLLAAIVASDTAQYYGGRWLGKRALAPSISPGKTVEGALFGLAAGALVVWALGGWWLPGLAGGWRLLLGLALVGLGIAGDLFESILKRSAGLKDASRAIPGHGGVLDRLDGFLFAAPVYYTVLHFASCESAP